MANDPDDRDAAILIPGLPSAHRVYARVRKLNLKGRFMPPAIADQDIGSPAATAGLWFNLPAISGEVLGDVSF